MLLLFVRWWSKLLLMLLVEFRKHIASRFRSDSLGLGGRSVWPSRASNCRIWIYVCICQSTYIYRQQQHIYTQIHTCTHTHRHVLHVALFGGTWFGQLGCQNVDPSPQDMYVCIYTQIHIHECLRARAGASIHERLRARAGASVFLLDCWLAS